MPESDSSGKTDQWETAAVGRDEETILHRVGRYRVERVLGRGAFGQVYLARDDELNRPVAIKVPHRERFRSPEDAAAFMDEARAVASLDHPAIVPVYDFGKTDDGTHFVVSKYIDGSTLSDVLRDRLPCHSVASLIATIAEALHHAHTRGLFHRDVKPANILLDHEGQPFITDFGIALKEADFGKGAEFVGTPAYMSPEQARGEGHRVDGRADVFSLGVVLYEGLTGRRPYVGDSVKELLNRISQDDVRPPRQLVDSIPRELERICLKALARRASERFTTARDLAEDLRHFLETQDSGESANVLPPRPAEASQVDVPETTSGAGSTQGGTSEIGSRVIPKGLRPFDGNDTEFFLELLPGPRDRDGLPDVLRFWKLRLQEQDTENSLAVGLVYGPSGCGKTSLIRAGLLPRLDNSIIPVYVEASSEETEADLLRVLRRCCPSLSHDLGLIESLAAIRRGQVTVADKKVTLIIDQFEQWLQAHVNEDQPELVTALRQCDGGRLQCIVMVRDDFWMAATRFMRQVEVRLIEGDNCAAVDLFDQRHATKVLTAFGRAYNALPAHPNALEKQQVEFVEQAISEISEAGQVIPVRLTLFAEMVKKQSWLPATLRSLGGASGVGVAFLEETFSGPTAPPEHRRHEKAARAVLQALLPEGAGKIRGTRRLASELKERSGYANAPDEFDRLIQILDGGVRLITPSDPEQAPDEAGAGDTADPATSPGERSYQLTHDYLVPSVREWLDKNRRRTMRDRAELRLIDRAEMWNARHESRQLPSLREWMSIRALVPRRHWSEPQRAVMRAAGRHHLRGVLLLCLILLGVIFAVREWSGRRHAESLHRRLLEADITEFPSVRKEIQVYRRWTEPRLRDAHAAARREGDKHAQLRVSLALVEYDNSLVDSLLERLLTATPSKATPQEAGAIRDALSPYGEQLAPALWNALDDGESEPHLPAAVALARFDAYSPKWASAAGPLTRQMLEDPLSHQWMHDLLPVRDQLFDALAQTFQTAGSRQSKAGELLIDYYEDRPEQLARLIPAAPQTHWAALMDALRLDSKAAFAALKDTWTELEKSAGDTPEQAERQARIGVALVQLGDLDILNTCLPRTAKPDLRSYLIEYLPRFGVEPQLLFEQTKATTDTDLRFALLLCLGGYDVEQLPTALRDQMLLELKQAYGREPTAAMHSALEWLLRRWGQFGPELQASSPSEPSDDRNWYVTGQGQTMAIIEAPVEFTMGSPSDEPNRRETEVQHLRTLPQTFALATTEVTVAQFQRFWNEPVYAASYAPDARLPADFRDLVRSCDVL